MRRSALSSRPSSAPLRSAGASMLLSPARLMAPPAGGSRPRHAGRGPRRSPSAGKAPFASRRLGMRAWIWPPPSRSTESSTLSPWKTSWATRPGKRLTPGAASPSARIDRRSGRSSRTCRPPRSGAAGKAQLPAGMAGDALGDLDRQEAGFADELRHEAARRTLIDRARRIELHDPSLMQDRHPVRHGDGFALIMGDGDGRRAEPAMQAADLDLHLLPEALVEGGERLVHQQDARLEDHGAGERHALALAAGDLVDAPLAQRRQLDQIEGRGHPALDLRAAHAPQLQGIGDIARHVHMREQRVVLEDHADVAAMRRHAHDLAAADADRAGGGPGEAGDGHEQGRLARARGAEQGDELARLDGQRDIVDGLGRAVVLAQPGDLDRQGATRWPRPAGGRKGYRARSGTWTGIR